MLGIKEKQDFLVNLDVPHMVMSILMDETNSFPVK